MDPSRPSRPPSKILADEGKGMQPSELYLELADYYDQRGEAHLATAFGPGGGRSENCSDANQAEHLPASVVAQSASPACRSSHLREAKCRRDRLHHALRWRHPPIKLPACTIGDPRPPPAAAAQTTLHVRRPSLPEWWSRTRPVEVYRLRDGMPPPTSIKPRPVPPPPPLPNPPPSARATTSAQESRRCRRCRAFGTFTSAAPSPFRPEPVHLPHPSIPVYQGIRMAPTWDPSYAPLFFFLPSAVSGSPFMPLTSLPSRRACQSDLVPNRE